MQRRMGLLAGALALGLGLGASAYAQETDLDDWEWEPGEGYHEEEWYDPSDWFDDDDGIDYESDDWDWDAGYGNDDDWYWDDTFEENDDDVWGYPHADDQYDTGWNDDFGDESAFDEGRDYGWHWEWNADANEWERDYGYHTRDYDYYTPDYQDGRQSGQQQGQMRRQRGQQDRFERSEAQRRMRHQQGQRQPLLEGQIEGFRHIQHAGDPEQHTLVRLRLRDGNTAVIDLGRRLELEQLNLQQGDRIVVRGSKTRMNNQTVLDARTIRVDGQTFRPSHGRSGRSTQTGMGGQQQQGSQRSLSGQIAGFRNVNLQGQRDQNTLIKLHLEDGTSATVNLGPRLSVDRLGLEQGTFIAIKGRMGTIDGRDVLMAEQIRFDGQTFRARPQGQRDMQTTGRMGRRGQTISGRRQGVQRQHQETLRGQVQDFRRLRLSGQPDEHTVLKLKLQDGTTEIVNLGPRLTVDQIGFQQGDRIAIQGRMGTINDRDVLMAERIQFQGETFRTGLKGMQRAQPIGRDQGMQRGRQGMQRGRQGMQQRQTLQGTIGGFQHVPLRGQMEEQTLIRLNLESGRSAVVDLGPRNDLPVLLQLTEGDRVRVQGRMGTIQGRDVLMAEKVEVDGTTMNVSRQRSRGQGSQGQRSRGQRSRGQGSQGQGSQGQGSQGQGSQGQGSQGQGSQGGMDIRGQVQDFQEVQLQGLPQSHTLLRLRFQDGRRCVVDLGPRVSPQQLNLEQGDQVFIKGNMRSLNGQNVIMAEEVRVGQETIQIRSSQGMSGTRK